MNEQRRMRQQLAQLSRDRQRLSRRNRDLRRRYRDRSRQRLTRVDSIVTAGLLGAASYYLASRWTDKDQAHPTSWLLMELRTLILELLNQQCDKWMLRLIPSLSEEPRRTAPSIQIGDR
ncbi:hypothetical protein I6N98_04770 [Spongiibacter nanhainus]|mgnify:CR=1 FL=1|uniref:Uncharacterized protein n=1 Tax=Spongiibacter nanhainus TaxID=2794344 RepID=A0A7T4R2C8_9GAMM|nr:hypothetical protein [Spongiibacter nanhainus]QQD19171.1 hypothetical protein I6N98_04770 [Spongiibacter nanhainus]